MGKNNYLPLSVPPNASKVFVKFLFKQISSYFDSMFSNFQFDFRKGYNSQNFLQASIEEWHKSMDQGVLF